MKLIICLAVSVLVQSVATQQPVVTGSAFIEGIVVKQGTNDPVAGVELELSRVEGTSAMPLAAGATEMFASILSHNSATIPANRAALPTALALEVKYTYSGNDGKFMFKDLKDGKYRLAAIRDGLYPVEFGQRHPTQRGIAFPVAAGQARTELKLEVTPTGAISGRVVDEEGQPVGHAVVYALAQEFRAGRQAVLHRDCSVDR